MGCNLVGGARDSRGTDTRGEKQTVNMSAGWFQTLKPYGASEEPIIGPSGRRASSVFLQIGWTTLRRANGNRYTTSLVCNCLLSQRDANVLWHKNHHRDDKRLVERVSDDHNESLSLSTHFRKVQKNPDKFVCSQLQSSEILSPTSVISTLKHRF